MRIRAATFFPVPLTAAQQPDIQQVKAFIEWWFSSEKTFICLNAQVLCQKKVATWKEMHCQHWVTISPGMISWSQSLSYKEITTAPLEIVPEHIKVTTFTKNNGMNTAFEWLGHHSSSSPCWLMDSVQQFDALILLNYDIALLYASENSLHFYQLLAFLFQKLCVFYLVRHKLTWSVL